MCKQYFSNAIYKLCRANSPGQKSIVTCSRRTVGGGGGGGGVGGGGQLSASSCSGGNYSQKNVLGPKVQGAIALGEIQEGCGNCLGGNY